MTLGNMRDLGGRGLVAYCLNDACRHQGLIDVSNYPADTEVPWFRSRVVCAKCGSRGNKIDVRPNWKEQPPQPSPTGKVFRQRLQATPLITKILEVAASDEILQTSIGSDGKVSKLKIEVVTPEQTLGPGF